MWSHVVFHVSILLGLSSSPDPKSDSVDLVSLERQSSRNTGVCSPLNVVWIPLSVAHVLDVNGYQVTNHDQNVTS